MRRFILHILGFFRLSQHAICATDNHDYPDGTITEPMHFHTYTCRHCGKEFTI